MPLTHPTARLPGRMTHPTAPSVARAIIAPSLDDLFGLRKLCGSDIGVIEYLANWYDMEADAIAPTVQGWLANCPDVQPPSRQRSAPGALTVNAGMATRSHLSHADDPFKTTSSGSWRPRLRCVTLGRPAFDLRRYCQSRLRQHRRQCNRLRASPRPCLRQTIG